MRPSETLRNHRNAVLQIAMDLGAKNVRVFGSVLHNKDVEGSDIDLLVDMPRGTTLYDMAGLQEAIQLELGISVDILTEAGGVRCRPGEVATMQATLAEPDAGAVPDQELEAVLAAVAEGVSGAVAGTASEGVLDPLGESVDAGSHVDRFDD